MNYWMELFPSIEPVTNQMLHSHHLTKTPFYWISLEMMALVSNSKCHKVTKYPLEFRQNRKNKKRTLLSKLRASIQLPMHHRNKIVVTVLRHFDSLVSFSITNRRHNFIVISLNQRKLTLMISKNENELCWKHRLHSFWMFNTPL